MSWLDKGIEWRWYYPISAAILGLVAVWGAWSMLYPNIIDHFGLETTAPVVLAFSLIMLSVMVFGPPIYGALFDKYGPKIPLLIAIVFIVVGFSVVSRTLGVNTWDEGKILWWLGSFLVGLAAGGVVTSTSVLVQARWFPDKYGTAIGIAVGGRFIAGGVSSLIIAYLLKTMGFGNGLTTFGLICAAIVFFLGVLPWKVPPVDWKPEGWSPPKEVEISGVTLKEAARDARFYILLGAMFCAAYSMQFFLGNLSLLVMEGLVEKGSYSKDWVVAAVVPTISAMVMWAAAAGNAFWGRVVDWFKNPFKAQFAVYFSSAIFMVLFYLGYTNLTLVYVLAFLLFFAGYGEPAVHYAAIPYLFGRVHVGKIMTIMNAVSVGVGLVTGPYIGAWLRDVTGGFLIAIVLAAVIRFIGSGLAVLGYTVHMKKIKS